MGSGSSSNIKAIRIDQKDEQSESVSKKESSVHSSGKDISLQPVTKQKDQDKDTIIETLTKQLCESESQRLDLEDNVETLVKELDYLNSKNIEREGEQKPCEETVHAKDHYISKLEKEKKDLETEINKMKQKQRRKQKQFNTQMAEYKQEVNFQMMELKEEINKLKAENKNLAETKTGKSSDSTMKIYTEEETPKLPGGEKMALILELSAQVTEQQDKISKLEHSLNERDQLVNDLRTKLKNNAQYLSVLNKAKEGKGANDLNSSGDEDKLIKPTKTNFSLTSKSNSSRSPMQKNDRISIKNDRDVDGLFTVDEESSEDEKESLVKLSSYLNGVKANNKVRMSPDQPEEGRVGVSSKPEPFEDLEANNGRDSGLGSAGKREQANQRTDWKDIAHSFEAGSGLSDSDFEQYGPGQSKIASAPPKLQNGGGARHKKKSSSLRRHASSRKEDRPPRPGMAFVNSVGTLHTDDHIVSKLSPIISPVEVS